MSAHDCDQTVGSGLRLVLADRVRHECRTSSLHGRIYGESAKTSLRPPSNEWVFFQPGFFVGKSTNNSHAYIVNYRGNNISICAVDSNTGALTNCNTTGGFTGSPISIAISRGYAYIVRQTSHTISQCPINGDGSLGTCVETIGGVYYPRDISIY